MTLNLSYQKMSSPDYVRLSTAADIALGFSAGRFYRDARLTGINLLLYYPDGCKANCLYCGQARENPGGSECKSLIRVEWPLRPLDEVAKRTSERSPAFRIVCVGQVCHGRAASDTVEVVGRLRSAGVRLPIAVLVTPTVTRKEDLVSMKDAGASMAGVAIDTATPSLFDRLRGKKAGSPHRWTRYIEGLREALEVFGPGRAGVHLIVGLGETERDIVSLMLQVRKMGGKTHLFSFYPEYGSKMERRRQPSLHRYRRIQLARYLIDNGLAALEDFLFNGKQEIISITPGGKGLCEQTLEKAFMTSGCPGCNRPFANERPSQVIRNFPWCPSGSEALTAIRQTRLQAVIKS